MMPPATSPSPSSSAMPAAHFRTDLHARDVGQPHRDAGLGGRQRNLAEIVERPQVTRGAHHVLGLAEFEHRAARLLVGLLHRVDDLGVRNVECAQPFGVEHDLVLAHHAADARDLRDIGDRLQLVLEEPVLQRAQLRQVHLSAAVDERVFVDPAHARRVGPERGLGLRPAGATAPGSGIRARASAPSTDRCRPRTGCRRTSRQTSKSRAPPWRPAPTASWWPADRSPGSRRSAAPGQATWCG